MIAEALGRDIEAEQHFQRAIALAPRDAESYYFYGRWLKGKGRVDQGAAELREAVTRNPAYMEARLLLLDTYAAQGAWPLLANLANETVQLVPGDPAVRRYAEMRRRPFPLRLLYQLRLLPLKSLSICRWRLIKKRLQGLCSVGAIGLEAASRLSRGIQQSDRSLQFARSVGRRD